MSSLLDPNALPSGFSSVDDLENFMTLPSQALVDDMAALEGDILVLGVGGKMGPTLARLAKRAAPDKRVVGVARFSEPGTRDRLESWGVETITCDLLDREAIASLPRLPNVVFMAGRKFGSTGAEELTWAMNAFVPALVAETFSDSRIVAFSTACVYPYVDVATSGAPENTPPTAPPGEYANSCVGRERMFQYFSKRHGTPGRLIRLSYAIDMRYGVLHDIARKVMNGDVINLSMGHVNVIWQGDANAQALRALLHCLSPTAPLNVSGPTVTSIRDLAGAFGRIFGKAPLFEGTEAPTAWLVDTAEAVRLFSEPLVSLEAMTGWIANWISEGGATLGKETHYDQRNGKY